MVQGKLSEGCTVTLSYDKEKEGGIQTPVKSKINSKRNPNKDANS
jgi:hypothetical protein